MIKHSESLDSWLKGVSSRTFESPLDYPEFEFIIKEFDNIPTVIPRFLFHMNNQIRWVWKYLKIRDEEERTDSVRKYFQSKNDKQDKEFDNFKSTVITDLKKQDDINSNHIKELYKQCQELFERQETIGALDLHRMLTITSLGFENKPVTIPPSSPKVSISI